MLAHKGQLLKRAPQLLGGCSSGYQNRSVMCDPWVARPREVGDGGLKELEVGGSEKTRPPGSDQGTLVS